MKLTLIFCIFFVLFAFNFAQQQQQQQNIPTNLPQQPAQPQNLPAQPLPTLSSELQDLFRLIPKKHVKRLLNRYLLQDAEFQTVVRILNSPDALLAYQRIKVEPEVLALFSWYNLQIPPKDESLELFESFEDFSIILPMKAFVAIPTGGLRGLFNELATAIPFNILHMQINQKRLQNPNFAQLITKIQQLERPYRCFLQSPNGQNIIRQLNATRLNTKALDGAIRNFFGWNGTAAVNCNAATNTYGFGNLFGSGLFNAPAAPPMVNGY